MVSNCFSDTVALVSGAPPACDHSSESRWGRFCFVLCVTSPCAVQCECHNVKNISVIITQNLQFLLQLARNKST